MSRTQILIVDDIDSHLTLFSAALRSEGYDVLTVRTREEALATLAEARPAAAIVDLVLPDGDGVHLIEEIKGRFPYMTFIAVTAFATIERAVGAMRAGAADFLVKPIAPNLLAETVAANLASVRSDTHEPANLMLTGAQEALLGSSPAIEAVRETITGIATSTAPVFISGESGTGKTRVAQEIHETAPYRDGPFVKIDCSTLEADAMHVELFGSLEGRGADNSNSAFQRARGGTIFLDEICALSDAAQGKLLNYLQESASSPDGAANRILDCRIICASSKEADIAVTSGQFRADLYYRLNAVPIELPPLRERGMDVLEISDRALAHIAKREGRDILTLSTEVKALFLEYAWPGNVRELINVLWNIALIKTGPMVQVMDLPAQFSKVTNLKTRETDSFTPAAPAGADPFAGRSLADIEKQVIESAIAREGGSIPAAARALEVSPSTLYRKLESWGQPARGARRK